jgi:hypothetical protein
VINKIPTLLSPTLETQGAKNTPWKLGQEVHGRVINGLQGNPVVNIDGSNYWLKSALHFNQGELLMLKVAGLSPTVQFSIIDRASASLRGNDATSVILSEKFLHGRAIADQNLSSSLSNFINLLHASSSQPFPPSTMLLINSLRNKLLRSNGLTNPKLIQDSFINGSLLVANQAVTSGSQIANGGLLPLLMQIARSLKNDSAKRGRLFAGLNYKSALGLSLYQNRDTEILQSFARQAEEQCLNLNKLRVGAQEDMQLQAYRLLVELPIIFQNHIRSISVRVLNQRTGEKSKTRSETCSVEFEFELKDNGKVYVRIFLLKSLASFFVGCEKNEALNHLTTRKNILEERLSLYGLQLGTFSCHINDGHLPLDTEQYGEYEMHAAEHTKDPRGKAATPMIEDPTRLQLQEVYSQGKMPELEEFSMCINNNEAVINAEIPEYLYCAMAAFFAQLLETAELEETRLERNHE